VNSSVLSGSKVKLKFEVENPNKYFKPKQFAMSTRNKGGGPAKQGGVNHFFIMNE